MSIASAGKPYGGALPPASQRLNQLLLGQFVARSLALAAELGIADELRHGPLSLDELAVRTRTNPDALYRMLRALAAIEVFEEQPGKVFRNSELSECLRSDVEGSLGPMARWLGDISGWTAWGRFDHSVRTGEPAFDAVFGADCFTWMQSHPDSLAVFQQAMSGYSALTGKAVAEAYDFSAIGTLLDVGGGHGAFLSLLLAKNPQLRGILFDRPEVIERAAATFERAHQASRTRLVSGSFLDGVPDGADAISLKHIVHDWDDDHCIRLLANCRRNLPRGGRLIIIEAVLTDAPEGAFTKFLDLEMLAVTPGGRERSAVEFERLLTRAGFDLSAVLPTKSPVSVIEGLAR
ncbi:MAG TPA: methyltransferase [Polyangiaceae bacterium]|nr:methyltransferase [Polyangiaceae bacterium]